MAFIRRGKGNGKTVNGPKKGLDDVVVCLAVFVAYAMRKGIGVRRAYTIVADFVG